MGVVTALYPVYRQRRIGYPGNTVRLKPLAGKPDAIGRTFEHLGHNLNIAGALAGMVARAPEKKR